MEVSHEDSNYNAASEEDRILHSSYKSVSISTLNTKSACKLIIQKSKQNAQEGHKEWVTNSVTGETLNYSDVEPMSRIAASAMARRGMGKGDIALYLTMDVTKIFTTILGVWRLGGVMYSSYPEDTEETIIVRIQKSKARWLFCDPISVVQVKSALKSVEWEVEVIVFGEVEGCTSIDEFYKDDGSACPSDTYLTSELDDPLLILCTSGTTGNSISILYTNKSVLAFCMGTTGLPRLDAPALLLLRSSHVLGCLFPLRNIYGCTWSLMMHQVTKTNIFKAVHDYKPQLAFGFPAFLTPLVNDPEAKKYDFSSLQVICSGGVVLTPQYCSLMMSLPNVKYVMNGYGLTECGALATSIDLSGTNGYRDIPNVPPLSIGRLYPNTSLRILDVDTGRALGPNQRGELTVQSPIMFAGYWGNCVKDPSSTFKDGWLKTGDLGYYDDNGFLFIVDRIKETFKYHNNRISPAELEEILLRHPGVAEACCFGIEDPEGGGRIPRAVIVLKKEAKASPQEIRDFVDAQVVSFKKIRGGVFIVPSLPRGKTGKVVRSLVAALELISGDCES